MDSVTKTLCMQARLGDRGAYDKPFALHESRAILFIRTRRGPKLREKIERKDVIKDAYLAAHLAFERFEYTDDGAFLRWLCRIIENRIRDTDDYFRAIKRQPVELPKSSPTGPITTLERVEHRRNVAHALDSVSEDHRQVLLLRFFEGLSAADAGRTMERSEGAIRKLTARALIELEKHL